MELVYLWVKKYKNITNQGFNFSLRFHCKYDTESNELSIEENENFIPDFFGENINVTAIVGKNGSGKSSLLDKAIDPSYMNGFAFRIFYDNKTIYYEEQYKANSNILINTELSVKKIPYYSSDIDYLYFDTDYGCPPIRLDLLDKIEPSIFDEFTDEIHIDDYFINYQDNSKILHESYRISEMMIKILKCKKDILFNFFLFEPNYFLVLENSYFKNLLKYDLSSVFDESRNNIDSVKSKKYDFLKEDVYNLYLLHKFVDLEIYLEFLEDCVVFDDRKNHYFVNYQKAYHLLSKHNEPIEILYDDYIAFDKYLIEQEGYLELTEIKEIKDIYLKFYTFDIYDEKHKTISDLSYGEKNVLSYFIHILGKILFSNRKNIFLILDEIDISLHPSWQKKYFNELINVCSKVDKKIHIILSTHSPFLLSDIPKQNIIFLDTDGNGNCKVVDGLKDKKQTFGANIHTLLSDSFFMEDGLMGEFAKGKINEIIAFHTQVENDGKTEELLSAYHDKKVQFWNTQKIIGEAYLQQIVKNHLIEIEKILLGKDQAKEEEIKRVERYIESLKND